MKTIKIESITDAIEKGIQKNFAFVRNYSEVTLGPSPQTINEDELLEARFFDVDSEIRIFRSDDVLCAVELSDEEDAEYFEERCGLIGDSFGRSLVIRREIKFDKEDGQAYLSSFRLVDWKEAQSDA